MPKRKIKKQKKMIVIKKPTKFKKINKEKKKVIKKTKKELILIDSATVERVARLALLELTGEEKKKFEKDLNEIISAFMELDRADIRNVEPSFQPFEMKDVVREDDTESSLSQQDALANTRHSEKGFFRGPRAV